LGFLGKSDQFCLANGDMWFNNTSVFILLTLTCVLGHLREGKTSLFREIFYKEFERYVKKTYKLTAFSIGTLLGKLGGGGFVYWDF